MFGNGRKGEERERSRIRMYPASCLPFSFPAAGWAHRVWPRCASWQRGEDPKDSGDSGPAAWAAWPADAQVCEAMDMEIAPHNINGLCHSPSENLFYFVANEEDGFSYLWTLALSGSVVKRMGLGYNFNHAGMSSEVVSPLTKRSPSSRLLMTGGRAPASNSASLLRSSTTSRLTGCQVGGGTRVGEAGLGGRSSSATQARPGSCRSRLPSTSSRSSPYLLGGPAELVQPCGQLRDLLPRRVGLRSDLPFPLLQPDQHRPEGQLSAGHALRQAAAVAPVSRRSAPGS